LESKRRRSCGQNRSADTAGRSETYLCERLSTHGVARWNFEELGFWLGSDDVHWPNGSMIPALHRTRCERRCEVPPKPTSSIPTSWAAYCLQLTHGKKNGMVSESSGLALLTAYRREPARLFLSIAARSSAEGRRDLIAHFRETLPAVPIQAPLRCQEEDFGGADFRCPQEVPWPITMTPTKPSNRSRFREACNPKTETTGCPSDSRMSRRTDKMLGRASTCTLPSWFF
jgi:hypothetical protein